MVFARVALKIHWAGGQAHSMHGIIDIDIDIDIYRIFIVYSKESPLVFSKDSKMKSIYEELETSHHDMDRSDLFGVKVNGYFIPGAWATEDEAQQVRKMFTRRLQTFLPPDNIFTEVQKVTHQEFMQWVFPIIEWADVPHWAEALDSTRESTSN